MYEIEPYVFDGELMDETQDCELAYERYCTNTDVEFVEDPYESDVNNNPGHLGVSGVLARVE